MRCGGGGGKGGRVCLCVCLGMCVHDELIRPERLGH